MTVVERPTDQERSIFAPALRPTTLGVLIVITLIAFEAMAVSAALPTAARDVHGLAAFGWAFTGFLVANVVGMVGSGLVSGRHGPRPGLLAGLVSFLGGLVLAGTASTMTQLIAGRFVQGLGSGLLVTAIYVVMGEAYPERLRPPLFAATSSAWVVPSLVGTLVCKGVGPVSVGPVQQTDCTTGAITGSVDPATAIRLQVGAPSATTWKFSLVDEPQTGTNGSLVALPNPALTNPGSEQFGAGASTGSSSVSLHGPSGPAVSNVRLIVTCNGDGVTMSSDDGSVVNQYTHSCFSGWSYEFDVTDVRLPTTLHVTADARTSWRLVAVPF